MNQGRIWCVVNPTIGLPLFLGSVALTSLAVHTAVLTHTTWMTDFFAGANKGKVAADGKVAPVASAVATPDAAFSVTVTPVPGTGSASPASYVIMVTPNAAPRIGAAAAVDREPAKPEIAGAMRSASAH